MRTELKTTLIAIVATLGMSACRSGQADTDECDVRIAWDRSTYLEMNDVYVGNKGYTERELHYPRIKRLSDGTLFMTFMNDHFGWDVFVRSSRDNGLTWSDATMLRQRFASESPAGDDQMVFVNPDFIELADGRLLLAYQWRYKKGYNDMSCTNECCGIEIMFSDDKGETFSAPRCIYTGRCWEPAMLQLPSGEIQMYITDSNETLDGVSQPCTIVIRSFDGGETWQGRECCSYRDGEIVSRTFDPRCTCDGMPTAVLLDNGGIAVPLEVWSGKFKMDQTPVIVRTDAETNWYSDQSVRAEGGPAYPWKKQLNKDFTGFGPYSTKLPTGEMAVLSNGTYKNKQAIWVFIGNKEADNFRFATAPFTGHWGSIDCIDELYVLGTGTYNYREGGVNRGGVRLMKGHLNYAKSISKGLPEMPSVADFDRSNSDWWFLGHSGSSSVWTTFGYTSGEFAVATCLFDSNLVAFTPENSDASTVLLARGSEADGWQCYKIVVNALGRRLIYREVSNSWVLTDDRTVDVELAGTVNDASDCDTGFAALLRIDWELLGGKPSSGEVLRAHLRHHIKDKCTENPFAAVEDGDGENSDYPSEWLRITLN